MQPTLRRAVYQRRFLRAYRRQSVLLDYPPLVFNVEPTNRCNLRCPFCPVSQAAHHPEVRRGFMKPELAAVIAEQVRHYRPLVALNMGGESTLHPRLPELCRIFRSVGSYVFLDTNATLLTEARVAGLLDADLSELVVCLDGDGTARSYEDMRVGGDFTRTVRNIRHLLAEAHRRKAPTKVVVKNIQYYRSVTPPTMPVELKRLFTDHPPAEFRTTWADYWPGDHKIHLVEPYQAEPYDDDPIACSNLWKKLAIGWDGRVTICCLDLNQVTHMGDVSASTIMEVWNGDGLVRARRRHRERDYSELPLCANCPGIHRTPNSPTAGLLHLRAERHTSFTTE